MIVPVVRRFHARFSFQRAAEIVCLRLHIIAYLATPQKIRDSGSLKTVF